MKISVLDIEESVVVTRGEALGGSGCQGACQECSVFVAYCSHKLSLGLQPHVYPCWGCDVGKNEAPKVRSVPKARALKSRFSLSLAAFSWLPLFEFPKTRECTAIPLNTGFVFTPFPYSSEAEPQLEGSSWEQPTGCSLVVFACGLFAHSVFSSQSSRVRQCTHYVEVLVGILVPRAVTPGPSAPSVHLRLFLLQDVLELLYPAYAVVYVSHVVDLRHVSCFQLISRDNRRPHVGEASEPRRHRLKSPPETRFWILFLGLILSSGHKAVYYLCDLWTFGS